MTPQAAAWSGTFGQAYTSRNPSTPEAINALCRARYGRTRTEMNADALAGIDPADCRVLEVGCNVGGQLLVLRDMGFRHLAGVEIQPAAVEQARAAGLDVREGNALSLPFADRSFDLVYTSGVLIHIAPADLPTALREIVRVSVRYVWGLEYWNKEHCEVEYRGHRNLLWKGDFAGMYLQQHPGELVMVSESRYPYLDASGNVDSMFLLNRVATPAAVVP